MEENKDEQGMFAMGKCEKVETFIGLYLNINTEYLERLQDSSSALDKNKREVVINIDDIKIEMTLSEFKERLTKNKR
jgi:hypothetical protein